jgi:hypothetical protein
VSPGHLVSFQYAYGRSRDEMASFFDPYIKIVLDGLRKPIEILFLDVDVGLLVIREKDY